MHGCWKRYLILWLWSLNGVSIASVGDSFSEDRIFILCNASLEGSVHVARHYAQARGIPEQNIVSLDLPTKERISARSFIDSVYNPVVRALIKAGALNATLLETQDRFGREQIIVSGHKIDFLVTTWGVPLSFGNDASIVAAENRDVQNEFRRTGGAVDAELSLLPTSGLPMTGMFHNPVFSQKEPSKIQLRQIIRVSRLDGPDPETVISMIDRTLAAEQTGLWGRAWIDPGGPHKDGDTWLEQAQQILSDTYWPFATKPGRERFKSTDRSNALAIYLGWYTAETDPVFMQKGFEFLPGAVAVHIHSNSAPTLRNPKKWTAGLIAAGASATVGNVAEPYLETTHQPHILTVALTSGKLWGEAVYASIPFLGWQSFAIGDPLYRPFAHGGNPNWSDPYSVLRVFNKLAKDDAPIEKFLEADSMYTGSRPAPAIDLFIAQSYLERGGKGRAWERLATYVDDPKILTQSLSDLWLGHEIIQCVFATGRSEDSLTLADSLIQAAQDYPDFLSYIAGRCLSIAESYVDLERIAAWRPLAEEAGE
ncbi:MAG: TIGR03790 family protein [Opitutales bacterium]|nr:TIGR03790 family protein [Opitutales bacterium]NRA26536.1 TIGR03790 family protein [Opitutales bacterium]